MAGGANSTSPNWIKSTSPQGIMGGLEGMMTGSAYEQKNPPFKKPAPGGVSMPTANQFTDAAQGQRPVTISELLAMLQGVQ